MAPLSDRRTVSVPAKPGPITLDISSTAALVVDMQNDFASKGGMFDRAGIDISITRAAIGPTAKVLACMREAGIRVVYLKQGHKADLSDVGPPDSPTPAKASSSRDAGHGTRWTRESSLDQRHVEHRYSERTHPAAR
jgi:nicotinamidase-related amidase